MLDRLRHNGVPVAFETEVISIEAVVGNVSEVTTLSASGLDNYDPCHVVSSMQIEDLAHLLTNASGPGTKPAKPPADVEQSVVHQLRRVRRRHGAPRQGLPVRGVLLRG